MADSDSTGIKWLADVADHDFDSAFNYLSIKYDDATAKKLVRKLRDTKIISRRSNDILRACGLTPLPISDPGVRRDLDKVIAGKKLSPVLVESLDTGADIADGYHRVSLAYSLDPFAEIPLRLAGLRS
jgi:hypothetical protein